MFTFKYFNALPNHSFTIFSTNINDNKLYNIYIKEAKLMNKNQSETSLIINLLHKKCFIHQLLKHNIINIQTTKNIDKTKLKDTCTRDQTAF